MMDRRATIVFDLDGTLVDTAPDLIGALNHVLTIHGRPVLAPEMVRKVVGFGAAVTIERGTALTGGIPAADIRAKMLEQFLAYYTVSLRSGPSCNHRADHRNLSLRLV
jgi:phosphoglycolate phosphatase